MGLPDLVLYDDDIVDDVNLATQMFRRSDVGNEKPLALAQMIEEFADTRIDWHYQRITAESRFFPGDITISSVDSIKARQDIWTAILRNEVCPRWYLDTRMAAEQYQHFAVDMNDPFSIKNYDQKLMSLRDEDVPDLVCTMKATFFCAMAAAGAIGTFVKNALVGNVQSHRMVYYLPTNHIDMFHL